MGLTVSHLCDCVYKRIGSNCSDWALKCDSIFIEAVLMENNANLLNTESTGYIRVLVPLIFTVILQPKTA